MNKTSVADNIQYKNAIQSFIENEDAFNTFKQNIAYKAILEHASYQNGIDDLEIIISRNQSSIISNLDKFKINDLLGTPTLFDFPVVGEISPSTLRYIKVLSDLVFLFEDDFTNKDIIEIGGGYGGQCAVLHQVFKFKSYTLVDLPDALKLAEKYLTTLGILNVKYISMESLPDMQYDICISNYAFTECSKTIQDTYLNKALNTSKAGYITANFISHAFGVESYSIEELLSKLPGYRLIEEEPLTHPLNKIIIWP